MKLLIYFLILHLNLTLIYVSATCSFYISSDTVYALCNGTYTIENATVACNTNGYYLAGIGTINNEIIWNSLTPSIK